MHQALEAAAQAACRPSGGSMSAPRDFELMGDRISVVTFAGTVQVLHVTDGWEGGPRKVTANRFAGRETAAELRAIADYLEALPWIDDTTVRLDARGKRDAA